MYFFIYLLNSLNSLWLPLRVQPHPYTRTYSIDACTAPYIIHVHTHIYTRTAPPIGLAWLGTSLIALDDSGH